VLLSLIVILILAVCLAALKVLFPTEFPEQEMTMGKQKWLGLTLALLGFVLIGHYLMAEQKALTRKNQIALRAKHVRTQKEEASAKQAHREYVLEIIGLGVTLDKYRQGKLWDILQKDTPYTSIREQDPKKYKWDNNDKIGISGSRACDAFENSVKQSPVFWGVPSFYAGPPNHNPTIEIGPNNPIIGLAGATQSTGLAWHLPVNAPWLLDEKPDRLLETIFSFFDERPDVPYIILTANDGMDSREEFRKPDTPQLVREGYYVPEMPDATAAFVLARRERVEPLRNFVWDDPDHNFVQEEFRAMYYQLKDTVPTDGKYDNPGVHYGRPPTIAEWLPAAAAFARNPEAHPGGHRKYLINFLPYQNSPPKNWKPTPWFPIPWNREQMSAFDALPTLGFLHRPVFVKFEDENGHLIHRREQRQQVLQAGWQQALQTLPEAERNAGPTRIVAGTNNNTEQVLALEAMLEHYAAEGGPRIDTGKTAQFINTDRRLGNTGAATFFVQMALGTMGSYREGGTSAAINLRDPHEASIVFITPPSTEKRKEQGDPFEHKVMPAIDPQNYAAPSPEALLDAKRRASEAKK
jgi:hypothetical protein